MITAYNITDEQIRELWAHALDVTGDRELAKTAQIALGLWRGSHAWKASSRDHTPCCVFVMDDSSECGAHPYSRASLHIEAARARCVEILNALGSK